MTSDDTLSMLQTHSKSRTCRSASPLSSSTLVTRYELSKPPAAMTPHHTQAFQLQHTSLPRQPPAMPIRTTLRRCVGRPANRMSTLLAAALECERGGRRA